MSSGSGGTTVGVPSAGFSPATLLARIKTVDGTGSGLDADLVRGTTPSAGGLATLALALGTSGKVLTSNGSTVVWDDAAPTGETIAAALEVSVVDATSPTELNALGGADPQLVLVYQDTGGAGYDQATLYRLQDWSGAQSLPYVVDSADAGRSWVAVSGRYQADKLTVGDSATFLSTVQATSEVRSLATVVAKPETTAGIGLDPNAATGSFTFRLSPANLTANRRATFGNADFSFTGGGTLALGGFTLTVPATGTAALLGSANAFSSTVSVVDGNFSILGSSDATKIAKFEVDGLTTATTRTFTLPDASIVVSGSSSALTSGRVPFATTGGLLTDSSRLTYSDSGGGGLTAAHASSSFFVSVSGAAGFAKGFVFNTGGVSRWIFQCDSTAESGGNAGSPFTLYARTDAGAAIDTPINIIRAAGGLFTISRPVSITDTTDATSSSTGAEQISGGLNISKNLLARQGSGKGLTSTATAAGTTTLTASSTLVQIFTGVTTQTLQLPAANLFGSNIAVEYIVINRSTGTVTAQRAGSDTFDGGGTTDAILTNTTRHYLSNGSNQWHTIA